MSKEVSIRNYLEPQKIKILPTGKYHLKDVIYCEDCRYCYEYENGEKICGNDEYEVMHIVTNEDFCSWAEPKEIER